MPSAATSTTAACENFEARSRLKTSADTFSPLKPWWKSFTTATDRSSYEYCTCTGTHAFLVP